MEPQRQKLTVLLDVSGHTGTQAVDVNSPPHVRGMRLARGSRERTPYPLGRSRFSSNLVVRRFARSHPGIVQTRPQQVDHEFRVRSDR